MCVSVKIILTLLAILLPSILCQNLCTNIAAPTTKFIRNPTSCSAWIACNNKKVVNLGSCDPGFNFDASIGQCRSSAQTECSPTPLLNICRGKPDGSYVTNPINCKGYLYCKNNIGFPGLCNVDQIFNTTSNRCVEYPNYICPNGASNSDDYRFDERSPCNYFSDGSFIASPDNCTQYFACQKGQQIKGSCISSFYFNPTTACCDKKENVKCANFGESHDQGISIFVDIKEICGRNNWPHFAKDPASCNGYYYCYTDSYGILGSCPDDLVFNPATESCDNRTNVQCEVTPCYGKPIGYFDRDPYHCSNYYYCGENTAILQGCENGYYFDVKNQNCNVPSAVDCEFLDDDGNFTTGGSDSTGEPDDDTISIPVNITEICDNFDRNFLAPDPASCSRFYECSRSELLTAKCKDGYIFNPDKQRCVKGNRYDCKLIPCYGKPIGYLDVDQRFCGNYYYCDKDIAISETCDKGYYFDVNQHKCEVASRVSCDHIIISSTLVSSTAQ